MEQAKWTERKFLFGYDKSYVPFLVERLKGTAPRLSELVAGCDETLAANNYGTGWSIKEHIGHLTDIEQLHDGRIDDYLEGITTLRPADMNNKATYEANHNKTPLSQLLADFRESRAAYISRVEQLDEAYFDQKALHPRLKQMITLADLLYFVAEHDNNHLTKVSTLLRSC